MKHLALSIASFVTLSTLSTANTKLDENLTSLSPEKNMLKRVHFKGDLRLRYESIEREDKDNTYRNRYRLRLGAKVDLIEKLQLEVGMRSGFANPTSGNQTFHTDKALKEYFFQSLRFNVLGLSYKSNHATYKVGRQAYMMYRPIKSQLVWDNDVSMNGLNYQYKDATKSITLGINQPSLEEASVSENTVNLFLAQYVHTSQLDTGKLNIGAGLYYYDGLKGNTTLFGKSKGNTLVNGHYANDYHIVQGFGEVQLKEIFGQPLKFAASLAYNFGADNHNFGYDVAMQIGKAKSIGEWQVKYSYTDLQEDAVFAAYSDSDNFGGGTGAKGHALRGKYKMAKNLYLAGNFFFNTLYASKSKTGVEAKYDRVQLDVIVKF